MFTLRDVLLLRMHWKFWTFFYYRWKRLCVSPNVVLASKYFSTSEKISASGGKKSQWAILFRTHKRDPNFICLVRPSKKSLFFSNQTQFSMQNYNFLSPEWFNENNDCACWIVFDWREMKSFQKHSNSFQVMGYFLAWVKDKQRIHRKIRNSGLSLSN